MGTRSVLDAPGRRGAALLAAVLTLGPATGAAAVTAVTFAGGRTLGAPAVLTAAAAALLVVTGSLLAAVVIMAASHPGAGEAPTATAEPRPTAADQALRDREAELAGLHAAVESLQSPLHALAGFAELLREEAPSARTFLDGITRNADRMLRVVEELRSYTAMAEVAMRPEPVDVERLALDVAASMLDRHTGTPPGIDVGELPVVTGDAALLRQVLEHLVDNAVRFVRHGSTARLRISAAETDGGWWRIEVADRGIGVPEEHRERIFAPFHRAPAADGYPGIGLGLAICRRIVAMHGGAIGVAANPGGGSVFHFTVSASDRAVPDRLAELTTP